MKQEDVLLREIGNKRSEVRYLCLAELEAVQFSCLDLGRRKPYTYVQLKGRYPINIFCWSLAIYELSYTFFFRVYYHADCCTAPCIAVLLLGYKKKMRYEADRRPVSVANECFDWCLL